CYAFFFVFSSRRRHTRSKRDWSSDVCSSDLSNFRHKNDPGVDILSIIYQHGINIEFPDSVIEETKKVPDKIKPEETKNRRDLREIGRASCRERVSNSVRAEE